MSLWNDDGSRIVELVLVVSNKHYDHGHTNQFSRGDLWCRVGEKAIFVQY